MSLRDQYFRDALHAITGVKPPASIAYEPATWGPSEDPFRESAHDWASLHAKPDWACGISMLEAAKAFVDDAEANCNIMNWEWASHPAKFERQES